MQEEPRTLWRSTLERIMRYANANPTTNMIALRQAAFDAKRLIAAGDPYVRIEELEAELAHCRGMKGHADDERSAARGPQRTAAGPA